MGGEQLLETGLESGEVRLQLYRAAVEDEQRLEDALRRIGSPRVGHAGIVATSGTA